MKVLLKFCFMGLLSAVILAGCGSGGGEGGGDSNPVSSPKAITAFSLDGVSGTINETAKTISVIMPSGTTLTALVATFTTTGASVKVGTVAQVSGTTPNNFGSLVVYTVTAADGTTAEYTVTVTVTVIKLPKTGQTTSYATGDDGDLEKGVVWPSPRFTVGTNAEADCVTDNLTGLMWVKAPATTKQTWANALTYANGLTTCNHDDWRMPNRKELRSLINYGEPNTATWLNTQGFSNVQPDYYWSSSAAPTFVWGVDMHHGFVVDLDKTPPYDDPYYVVCVRAGQ